MPAHDRQDGTGDVHEAEDVGGVLALDRLRGAFLEHPHQGVSGVVDQDVDAAEAFDRGVRCRERLRLVGHVQRQGQYAVSLSSERPFNLFTVAIGRDHPVPHHQCRLRNLGAQPASGARDEPYLGHMSLRPSSP